MSRETRIYVGHLPVDCCRRDIDDLFYKYGKISDIDLKNRRAGSPFAFVNFEDYRYALKDCLTFLSYMCRLVVYNFYDKLI